MPSYFCNTYIKTLRQFEMELQNSSKKRNRYIFGVTLVASVGGFLFGFDLVIIAGALPFLETDFQLTPALKGFAVSSAILGAIAGPLFGLWFTDRIGRKKTMMVAAVFFMISTVGCAFARYDVITHLYSRAIATA